MRNKQIHSLPSLKDRRRALRNGLTPYENMLWEELKNKKLFGRKFRRQHSIENYIVDFYCASEKLIIELDGAHHYSVDGMAMDKERDEKLEAMGFKILRIENYKLLNDISVVLQKIADTFTTH